ncbi:hypothetical protein HMI49_00100 [Corallococcus exercitus]|uniref:Uncharacterized protein n=1 Tax=Corallococcus exercitus TaxID=2316736 RepID=A0A7Y4KEW3_9BACT|nr:hypothetical protein [Corallococcus exercitus]NOK31604.1 hypothetical protein [Corallococcus exercitus]
MANITVNVATMRVRYNLRTEVKHGDTVVFTLGTASVAPNASITFPNGTCFTEPGPFFLGADNVMPHALTVSDTAKKGVYLFEVSIPANGEPGAMQAEGPPSGRKNGGIEVIRDPPVEVRR